jgi:hypothetical protein
MEIGKLNFIHKRNYSGWEKTLMPHGGMTVAWIIDPDTMDLVIGRPAICHPKDMFCKATGRAYAINNLSTHEVVRISHKTLMIEAADYIFETSDILLSGSTRMAMQVACLQKLHDDLFTTMSSCWFADRVRTELDDIGL